MNFQLVTYEQLLALREEANSKLYAIDRGGSWELKSTDSDGVLIESILEKQVLEALAVFESTVLPHCNKPIEMTEVRFKTHDWSDASTWDGRTHGDQVAYLAGGVMKHPIDGSWLDATGASMVAAYGGYPNNDHLGDPNYLFGALAYRIAAVYDDVNYKWTSADGSTRYAWLDTSVTPAVWKNDAGTVVVHYDTTTSEWIRDDNNAVVTNSLWRILPYTATKLQINKVKTTLDSTALFSGALHYQIYMNLDAGVAGSGYPAGNYKVADWEYQTVAELAAGSDATPYIEPITRPGHSGPIMILAYDYASATKTPVIDARLGMHLDISLSDNSPATQTLGASATFICMKIASF
jgi:hypothetical protein